MVRDPEASSQEERLLAELAEARPAVLEDQIHAGTVADGFYGQFWPILTRFSIRSSRDHEIGSSTGSPAPSWISAITRFASSSSSPSSTSSAGGW